MTLDQDTTLAVTSLDHVDLPLAVEFGKKFKTVSFDLSRNKIDAHQRYIDPTGEVAAEDFKAAVVRVRSLVDWHRSYHHV